MSNLVMTRPTMRDKIRRRLGKSTSVEWAIEIGQANLGMIGDPHPSQPLPTNQQINDGIEDTLSDLNIQARLGGMDSVIAIPLAGQIANGPYRVNLQTDPWAAEAQINEVKRVWWNNLVNDLPALRWTSDRDMDANRVDYQSVPPAIPQNVWTTKYGLFILPAPSTAGILKMYAGRALLGPVDDSGTIEQLPSNLFYVVLDGAAWRVGISQTEDQPMRARAETYGALYNGTPTQAGGVEKVKMTMGSMGQNNPRLIAQSYRVRRTSR
jgi:hypothetical protein